MSEWVNVCVGECVSERVGECVCVFEHCHSHIQSICSVSYIHEPCFIKTSFCDVSEATVSKLKTLLSST